MKWLVIGISGPTCSGKTTLANKLHKDFKDSVLICQDQYFLPKDDPRHTLIPELNHFNWEILSSLDMPKMHSDLVKVIESKNTDCQENGTDKKFRLLIVEGFSIYNYKPIADLCDQKYFIEISRDECWNRRKDRVYDPPDVPGYFDKIVWPEYLKYKYELTANTDLYATIRFLSGLSSANELYNEVIREIAKPV